MNSCCSWERLTWNTLAFISLFHRRDDNVCVHVSVHGFLCAYMLKSVFYVLAWFSCIVLTPTHSSLFVHSGISGYVFIVLRQLFPLRSANQPLHLHQWQWSPQWAVVPAFHAVTTDRSTNFFYRSSTLAFLVKMTHIKSAYVCVLQEYEQEFLQRRFSGGSQSYGGDSPRLSPCSSMGKLSKSDEQLSSMEQDSGQCSRNTSCETLGKNTSVDKCRGKKELFLSKRNYLKCAWTSINY